jgi:NitT/TauT family transport system substrate-binding protein
MTHRIKSVLPGRVTVGVVLALSLALAGCGSDDADDVADGEEPAAQEDEPAEEDDEADDEPEPLEPVGSVTMGTIAIPGIYAMVLPGVAEAEGFFDKYGVDVTLRAMETGVDAARAVQGGDLDFAFSPTGPVMTFAGTGVDVTSIMGLDNIDWLVGSVDPAVQTCEDLAGQEIAVDSIGGARYSVLEIILDSCGLSIDDVDTPAFPGPAAIQAVAAGQLDTSVIHIDDLYVIEEQGDREMHVVTWLLDVDPTQHYLVLWALDQTVESNRAELVRALAALTEAVQFMNDPANEDRVAEIAAEVTAHSPEVARASLHDFLELEFWPLDRHGLPQDKIDATIAEQVRLENIAEGDAPEYADVVDTSLWEEAFELVQTYGG